MGERDRMSVARSFRGYSTGASPSPRGGSAGVFLGLWWATPSHLESPEVVVKVPPPPAPAKEVEVRSTKRHQGAGRARGRPGRALLRVGEPSHHDRGAPRTAAADFGEGGERGRPSGEGDRPRLVEESVQIAGRDGRERARGKNIIQLKREPCSWSPK